MSLIPLSAGDKQQLAFDSAKAGSAWLGAGVTASDIAAYLAAFYTCLLIGDWFWKKLFRRQALKRGWIKPQRHTDEHEDAGV